MPDRAATNDALRVLLTAADTTGTGLDPSTAEVADPVMAVLHERDTDSYCTVRVYLDDVETTPAKSVTVDPGAGVLRTELEERIAEVADDESAFGIATHTALIGTLDSDYVIDNRTGDARSLGEAVEIVKAAHPIAREMHLETSDQDTYGFVLTDVVLAGGHLLSATDPQNLAKLQDAVSDFLGDLDWDGVVGEDAHGHAEVPLL